MKVVYKYPLKLEDIQKIELPLNANILKIDSIFNGLFLWALVDIKEPKKELLIKIFGTGKNIEDKELLNMEYFDTVKTHDSQLIWHIFIEK